MMPTRTHHRSVELANRAGRRTPGGVHSNIRLGNPRIFFARGAGAWLWDVDGNDYVDYLLGQGANFLGHAPPDVTAEVIDAVRHGMVYGAQHPLEVEAGERFLAQLGWADMVRFGMSGTECVQAALRLARAVTGRRRFVRFEGHYHGWLDNVLVALDGHRAVPASAGQLRSHLGDSVMVPWNDADALAEELRAHGDDLAAVIMEPVMCNVGAIEPRLGYLERVRQLCDEHGVVLVFDEVITGFRLGPAGAAERFGVRPDLAIYGKAMAGGWPVAALAGRGELMDRFGTGEVNHSGTFNASVMAAAAVVATMRRLAEDPPYAAIESHGIALMDGLRQLAAAHDLPLRIQGLPMAFHASISEDAEPFYDCRGLVARDQDAYARLSGTLAEHGVWLAPRGIWFVSAAHGDAELQAVLGRVDAALAGP